MSEFEEGMLELHEAMVEQVGRRLTFNGKTAQVIPSEAQVSHELRETGLWEQGSMIVEMTRADLLRLFGSVEDADRKTANLAGKAMDIFVVGDDPSDPLVRLHLKPAH